MPKAEDIAQDKFVPEQAKSKEVKKYVVRNRTRDIGYYYKGLESFVLNPGTSVVLDWEPTLKTAEVTVVSI